jgi:hypothetical protein
MAKILPPEFDTSLIYKEAERKVLTRCKEELPPDWVVIYSLWIQNASYKVIGEIDLVLIADEAVLCLEVKGGKVARAPDGMWEFRTRRGELKNRKPEGPFEQVRQAHFDLKKHLTKSNNPKFLQVPWWYGVITPDCLIRIPSDDTEIAPEEYCGEKRFNTDFPGFIRELVSYTVKEKAPKRPSRISAGMRDGLGSALRGSIKQIEGLGIQIHRLGERYKQLTTAQFGILQMVRDNPRIVLNGGAGTGKTLLAFEMARSMARDGKKVLFTCFNRRLADYLNASTAGDASLNSLECANYHQLLLQLCRRAGVTSRLPEDWHEFTRAAGDILEEVIDKTENFTQFDYLVIDEGQDLMRQDFHDALDILLTGGLSEGSWLLCLDPEQAIFSEQYDSECEQRISQKAIPLQLDRNIRNTKQIAAYTYGLSSVRTQPKTQTEGKNPDILYYTDIKDLRKQLKKKLNVLVTQLLESDGHASSITALATKSEPYLGLIEELSSETVRQGQAYDPVDDNEDLFSWSTVQAFKGLESDVVLLLGISDLTSSVARRLLYVGASRAKAQLIVFLPSSQQAYVQSRTTAILELIGAVSAAR